MRRWQLRALSYNSAGYFDVATSSRHWTQRGARRKARILRLLGVDCHWSIWLLDRATGIEVGL